MKTRYKQQRTKPSGHHPMQGFTLVELMIALFIFALMMTIAVTGLYQANKNKEISDESATEFTQLQLAILTLQRDVQQMIDRPILDKFASPVPSFTGTTHYMEFTRAGASPLNTGNHKASQLLRIAYHGKTQFLRTTWSVLDRTPGTKPETQVLIQQIQSLEFEYLDEDNRIYTTWPNVEETPSDEESQAQTLPSGINVKIRFANKGEVNFLIPIFAHSIESQDTKQEVTEDA